MPRPLKSRTIAGIPRVTVYKPAGVPARGLEWTRLRPDELEALRLVDAEGLEQAQAAERMGVSRPTVTRIVASARRKVALAISSGQAIAIETEGPIVVAPRAETSGAEVCRRGFGRGMGRGCGRRFRGGRE